MALARKVELSEVIGRLPDIREFDANDGPVYRSDDLFICALGFEPRCLALPKLLSENDYRSDRVVVLEYDTNIVENEVNRKDLTKHLNVISPNVQPLSLSDPDYPNELRRILDSIAESAPSGRSKVTFDLSVAANRIVVTCIGVLLEAEADLNVIYSEAAIYHPTKAEYQAEPDAWQDETELGLERGVADVRPSREFPGQHFDQLPDAIILFPTFKPERSRAVITFVDPSLAGVKGDQMVWLVGVPHLQENRWRIAALKEINGFDDQDVQYEISTLDYKETLTRLETTYHRLSDQYKLTLSPIGSKMQALGSSLFSYIHPNTRIVFAIPNEYNAAQYSEGCRATWIIEFGPLSDLRDTLGSVGKLVIDD